ncbi:hypothetical protein [Hoeflea sp.]|uniref:hypothetical protein n=1 Tax=Hoeflea sp. TaxID=1940281 RepID=UPI0019B8B111|nr:hypothetical protein [Hoeflea sp.]MBC7280009.1 hypothetical protein [Hoeflea sp.]
MISYQQQAKRDTIRITPEDAAELARMRPRPFHLMPGEPLRLRPTRFQLAHMAISALALLLIIADLAGRWLGAPS